MTANTKQTLTTITDRSVIAVTCGRPVTSGVTNKPPPNSPHSALSVARTAFASQSMTPSISQPTSGAEDVLEDGQDDRGEQGQAVADAGRLQRAFGPLHLGGVTAGHQVAGAADGQEQGGDRGDDAGDPHRHVVDQGGEVGDSQRCGTGGQRRGAGRHEHGDGRGGGHGQADEVAVHGWLTPPAPAGGARCESGSGASPREVGCGAVGAVLLHRPKGERGEHDPSGRPGPAPDFPGWRGEPRVAGRWPAAPCDSLPTKGCGWVPNSAPAPDGAPNWHPTDPTGPRPAAVAAVPGALSTVSPRRPGLASRRGPPRSNHTDPGGLVAQTQKAGRRPLMGRRPAIQDGERLPRGAGHDGTLPPPGCPAQQAVRRVRRWPW